MCRPGETPQKTRSASGVAMPSVRRGRRLHERRPQWQRAFCLSRGSFHGIATHAAEYAAGGSFSGVVSDCGERLGLSVHAVSVGPVSQVAGGPGLTDRVHGGLVQLAPHPVLSVHGTNPALSR